MLGFIKGIIGQLTVDYGMRVTPAKNSNEAARILVLDNKRVYAVIRETTFTPSDGKERNIVMMLVKDKDFYLTGFPEEIHDLHR